MLDDHKDGLGDTSIPTCTGDDWEKLVGNYKARWRDATGHDFPQDPHDQLWGAIGAVFASWMNERANDLPPPARHSG